jgi:hypothetical protein
LARLTSSWMAASGERGGASPAGSLARADLPQPNHQPSARSRLSV